MKLLVILVFAQMATAQLPAVASSRIEAELAADAAVLRSLKKSGDMPNIVRPVDVRFVGSAANIGTLQQAIGSMGWRVVQRVPISAGEEALDIQRDQTTSLDAIRALTETALSIEVQFGVRYDGWGTVATKR